MDNLDWKVEDYTTEEGVSLVEEYIDSLPAKPAKKIVDDINLLERFGPRWGWPHVDYFKNDKVYELRVKHASNIYRIFFFIWKDTVLILTNGFTKKSQKTPRREIDKAVRLKDDWISRKGM